MNAALLVVIAAVAFYFIGYRMWSRMLEQKVFAIRDDEVTPANNPNLQDNMDYVPTRWQILWGHHYTSIAGAAPIIGPAVAVFWGWLPALVWIVFGAIFIGAMHDMGALLLSARKGGNSIADIAGQMITPRVRILFLLIIYFLLWILLAVFAFSIGVLFDHYPSAVIPINIQIIVALLIGYLFHRKGANILIPSIIAIVFLYASIYFGMKFPISLPSEHAYEHWAIILIIYGGIASLLPVWLLLQPRDYLNSFQLIIGLGLLFIGLAVLNPELSAPAINSNPVNAPPLFPLLFVTIACGAISGFHAIVASGTTSKQLNKMTDCRKIAYGGMLGEALLAVIALAAVAAGLQNWHVHYANWDISGINAIAKFVEGGASFIHALGIPTLVASTLVAMLAVAFAATSMDTAARIQRYIITEFAHACKLRWLENRYLATLVAVLPAIILIMAGREIWGALWLLFGTTNQLIGGMTLLVLFTYLFRAKRPTLAITLPMILVITVTTIAMLYNLFDWIGDLEMAQSWSQWLTITVGSMILCLEIWMLTEAVLIVRKLARQRANTPY